MTTTHDTHADADTIDCEACGADAQEPCRPGCIGWGAAADERAHMEAHAADRDVFDAPTGVPVDPRTEQADADLQAAIQRLQFALDWSEDSDGKVRVSAADVRALLSLQPPF